ncbi:hypothetical protein [Estrella lausannensis]|uniref:Putative membrane protein n=1 Tax=Estrella lausannensis TaxID=483423 RepID=A0A0H5DQD5_9BACT|nr:hypothetical protein [Estrella lausannensis]CRX38727.1 putative membrane protein [Estrella lausannensis]
MATIVCFDSGSLIQQEASAPSQPLTYPHYQAVAGVTSDVGEQILDNTASEGGDRNSIIKAVVIIGGTIAIAAAFFAVRALLPDSPVYPYVFAASLLLSGALLCAPVSPYEHMSRMALQ